jgi:hypothetical protein
MQQFAVLKRKLGQNVREIPRVRNDFCFTSLQQPLETGSIASLTSKVPKTRHPPVFVDRSCCENVDRSENSDDIVMMENCGEGEIDYGGDFQFDEEISELLSETGDIVTEEDAVVEGTEMDEPVDADDTLISEKLAQCELDEFHLSDLLDSSASRKQDLVLPRVRIMVSMVSIDRLNKSF